MDHALFDFEDARIQPLIDDFESDSILRNTRDFQRDEEMSFGLLNIARRHPVVANTGFGRISGRTNADTEEVVEEAIELRAELRERAPSGFGEPLPVAQIVGWF